MAVANIVCPSCGKEYTWQQQLAGHTVRCTCGQVMPVPSSSTETDSVYQLAPSEDAKPMRAMVAIESEDEPSLPCPSCGNPIEFAGVVCTACGYNVKTGLHSKPMSNGFEPIEPHKPPPQVVPQFGVPIPPPHKQVEDETRRDVLMRYASIVVVLLVLVGVVWAVKALRTPAAANEDVVVAQKIESGEALEVIQWLGADKERSLGRYNKNESDAAVGDIYRAGATRVWCFGARNAMAVHAEVPPEPEKRAKFFDWYKRYHAGIGETAVSDSGQKFVRITIPR